MSLTLKASPCLSPTQPLRQGRSERNTLDFLHSKNNHTSMVPRTDRPRTGITPNFVVRVDPRVADSARAAARASGKRVGTWLEEAIGEKIGREGQPREPHSGNVNERGDRAVG